MIMLQLLVARRGESEYCVYTYISIWVALMLITLLNIQLLACIRGRWVVAMYHISPRRQRRASISGFTTLGEYRPIKEVKKKITYTHTDEIAEKCGGGKNCAKCRVIRKPLVNYLENVPRLRFALLRFFSPRLLYSILFAAAALKLTFVRARTVRVYRRMGVLKWFQHASAARCSAI